MRSFDPANAPPDPATSLLTIANGIKTIKYSLLWHYIVGGPSNATLGQPADRQQTDLFNRIDTHTQSRFATDTEMAPSKNPYILGDPFARKSVMASHFQANQPSLMASRFMSYASEAAAHDAEAHGHAHVPKPTYLTLILEDCLPIEKVKDIVASQVPELEPVSEEPAKLGLGEGEEEEEVKICRIRGAVKGWYNVLQDILTDEGDVFYLKRVPLVYRGELVDAYRPVEHFPRPKTKKQPKRKSVESTPRSKSDAMHGLDDKRKSSLGRFLHWRQKSHDTPRSHSIS